MVAEFLAALMVDGKQEQRMRLVNGFSAIEPRGIEKDGTVPSSVCKVAPQNESVNINLESKLI